MRPLHLLPAAVPALALGAVTFFSAPVAVVGDALPRPELENFKQTEATSFADYAGRTVLIEFFEYW